MKPVSTKKHQLKDEELKAFVTGLRSDFVAFLKLVRSDKKAPLTEEEIDYWRCAFADQAASFFRQQIESDFPDVSFDPAPLADCLYKALNQN